MNRYGLVLAPCATPTCRVAVVAMSPSPHPAFDDFGDFGVLFASTVAGRYTRRGGPRRSVRDEPLIVLTRGP